MNRLDSGFTLLEMIVVVAIIAMIAAAAIPTLTAVEAGEKYRLALGELADFEAVTRAYARDTAALPDAMTSLTTQPNGIGGWLGPYLTTTSGGVPLDPWGNAYLVTSLGGNQLRFSSGGPDGVAGNADDVSRDADLTFDLRTRTRMIVDTVNRAIALYNGMPYEDWTPLPANIDQLVSTLRSEGYLDSSVDWTTDGFGEKLATSSAPVTAVSAGSSGATPGWGNGSGNSNSNSNSSGNSNGNGNGNGNGKGNGKGNGNGNGKGIGNGNGNGNGKGNGNGNGKGKGNGNGKLSVNGIGGDDDDRGNKGRGRGGR
jgi:type II secretion system protein G